METTTTAPEPAEKLPETSHAPQPIDPERDINARSTTLWLVSLAGGLFVSLWLLAHLFYFVLEGERQEKINEREPTELESLRSEESRELQGLEKSLEEYVNK